MAKHPNSSRVHREEHAPDDAFVATVKRSYAWGRENSTVLIVGIVLILVVGLGSIWFISAQRQLESQAATRFAEVQGSVASGNVQLAIRDLRSYLDQFGSTETADQARLLLADLLLSQDQGQQAVETLGDLPDDLDRPYAVAAARLKATALEEAGQVDEAVGLYERIADQARFTYQRREALADAARVRLQNGQPDRAALIYQDVVDTFEPQEQGRSYYQMWLAEARARAETGTGTTPTVPDTSTDTAAG